MRKILIAFVVLVSVVFSGFLPALASSNDEEELMPIAAWANLVQGYPDPINHAAIMDQAIAGMADKLREVGCDANVLAFVPAEAVTTDAIDHFAAEEKIALASCDRVAKIALEEAATERMLWSLHDSHTSFIPAQAIAAMTRAMFGGEEYSGIGVSMMFRWGRTYFSDVIKGGSADRAGIQRLDQVVAVGGVNIEGLSVEEANRATQFRGSAGTTIDLMIKRAGVPQPLYIRVTRELIVMTSVEATLIGSVGYVKVRVFRKETAQAFGAALEDLKNRGATRWVFDLRGNGGGIVRELNAMLSMLLPAGLPVSRDTYQNGVVKIDYTAGEALLLQSAPVAVLVDDESASCSEVFAAAVQEYGRGVVVGTKTAGAVETAVLASLPGGAAMEMTVARSRTGSNQRLEGVGVTPNLFIEFTLQDLEKGIDSQLQRALQVLK